MEMAIWIYLYLTAGKLIAGATVIASLVFAGWGIVVFMSGCFSGFGTTDSPYSQGEKRCYLALRKYTKPVCILFFSVIAFGAFYPSKEDIAWIVGGSVAAGVATSEEARKLPDNVLSAANSFLEGISEKDSEPKAE